MGPSTTNSCSYEAQCPSTSGLTAGDQRNPGEGLGVEGLRDLHLTDKNFPSSRNRIIQTVVTAVFLQLRVRLPISSSVCEWVPCYDIWKCVFCCCHKTRKIPPITSHYNLPSIFHRCFPNGLAQSWRLR